MSAMTARLTPGFLLMLSALTALAPLGTDIYLSAVPVIASEFSKSLHEVELSVSVFLMGFSLGQLLGGPLSDRYGRRTMVITGLAIFAVGAGGILLSQSLDEMLVFRAVQALGGGLAVVNSTAIIRDLASGREGASAMIRVIQVMMVAPLIAPLLGMFILKLLGWHAIFGFLLVYALLLIALFYYRLPETRKVRTGGNPLRNYWQVLGDPRVWGFIASTCGAYAGMLSFVTSSPGIFMGYFGLTETVYPLVFGCVVFTMLSMSKVNLHLLKRLDPPVLIGIGQKIQITMALLMIGYVFLFDQLSVWLLTLMLMLYVGSHGFVVANATSSITEFFPHLAGTATALVGAMGFASGGIAGSVVSSFSDGSPKAMICMMLAAALFGFTVRTLASPKTSVAG
ncbi:MULTISPECIES: multidrug effflux MFS transporter [unclassified Oceanobacter]|jgi:DHA1 family bicyclomycin/chloramphenicol resistance-like MFS transporter|uniref:multidrug effflux MFS transporter n=1 Tax=unclassified Oceanobacter TaxID=2620260 RepID=UPI0026E450CF|nr:MULTISPECIES: multidrug effflux MFS transporter [unclassified Oceanobacter]MDO6682660.1 multidrug effflux MFS transporter [Oceanobacter sp. 5_MG-2023]MDP2505837.1 multidrug effflux MFS transporter [Oceanobacter sp. 3_MG-2023]MDP2548422.1 multidrug effflux MFS transporter [Oceanobacter sp. 4_MG-2023]MDP2609131.1 multidrug effflux MFS transporter [Oceanobacter sp. 1_MG-2023]MDP2612453.1 multidrug effflux MFS transporter [Oceanobacter sp. 2_MG-2023]